MSVDGEQTTRPHILRELGFAVTRAGDDLIGSATIRPEMYVPGTSHVRASILAVWSDILAGLLAAESVMPRVPVTLDLDVHLYRPAPGSGLILGTGRTVKSGRNVFVARVEFTSEEGEPVAEATGSFMLAPDPSVVLPSDLSIDSPPTGERLSLPLAERARCERRQPGVAVLPKSEDGLNSSNTVNGGLIALVVEEAALSLSPGDTLCSIGLRYLQPVRVGPVVATARVHHGLGHVEVRDAGNENRLSCAATTRTFAS